MRDKCKNFRGAWITKNTVEVARYHKTLGRRAFKSRPSKNREVNRSS
jgi:hypothetical protein